MLRSRNVELMQLSLFRGLWALTLTLALALGLAMTWSGAARAQDGVFLQIESHPSLATAEQRVRAYAQVVPNVNGFRAGNGWYAIALGPYSPPNAQRVLNDLLAQGLIPRDSFVETGDLYATQFFPLGSNVLNAAPANIETQVEVAAAPVVEPQPIADETPQEARQSEAQLDRPARDALQIALQWFGFYNSGIDGAFGPGTRAAMTAYQDARGMEPTGILTTRQRAQLLDEYQGELAALGMRTVRDDRAGIEIELPMAMIEFSRHNFPFAQFDPINDSGVQVLLISQPGDRNTLFGLYEIMQTLEIVPLEGERQRGADSFLLTGQSDVLRSHTEARLVNGAVKGFTLVWPPERDDQMARVLPMMQASLRPVEGVLDPTAIPDGIDASIDMVSGLDVRRPDLVRSGFFADAQGSVLTTTEVVAGMCAEILINNAYPAEVAFRDDALGLAVLRPLQPLSPLAFAEISGQPGRVRSDVAVSGFPFDGTLNAASMSFGSLADLRGFDGEQTVQRLDLSTADSEAGGPVFDVTGSVLGMVLPGTASGRALPQDVTLAAQADQLANALAAAGLTAQISTRQDAMNRENLARLGADMTVTVSCWN